MVKCDVIQDLLPLYIDDVASEGSRVEVDEHIKTCSNCREVLSKMQAGGNPIRLSVDKAEIGAFKIMKQKLLRKNLLIACASVVATSIVYGLVYLSITDGGGWTTITLITTSFLFIISSIVFHKNMRKNMRKVNNTTISDAEALIKSKNKEFLGWPSPQCFVTFEFINSPDIKRLRVPQEKFDALSEGEKGILHYKIIDENMVKYVDFSRN